MHVDIVSSPSQFLCSGQCNIVIAHVDRLHNSWSQSRWCMQGTTKRDIVITHVDTLDNDWIQLAHTIAASPNSYTAASDRVYGHFQAKSFFEQVAPDQTVALAYSGLPLCCGPSIVKCAA